MDMARERQTGTWVLIAALLVGGCWGGTPTGDNGGSSDKGVLQKVVDTVLFGLGMGTAMLTSRKKLYPPVEVTNETESNLEFVDSAARIGYAPEEGGFVRTSIDGRERTALISDDSKYAGISASRNGETVVIKHREDVDPDRRLHLYRKGTSKTVTFPAFDGYSSMTVVSPDGRLVGMVAVEPRLEEPGGDTYTTYLLDTEAMEIRSLCSGFETKPVKAGWSADSSKWFVKSPNGTFQHTPETDESTFDSNPTVDWSQLHRADPEAHRCEGASGIVELEDPADENDWEAFEGLERVHEDGSSERLVEVQYAEDIEDFDDYLRSPFETYFFTPDCNYVVFKMRDDPAIRVVDVDSKAVGTLGRGNYPMPLFDARR